VRRSVSFYRNSQKYGVANVNPSVFKRASVLQCFFCCIQNHVKYCKKRNIKL